MKTDAEARTTLRNVASGASICMDFYAESAQLRVIYGQVDPIKVGPLCTGSDIVFGAAT